MEQKIYPLNIGQGDEKRLLTQRPPKKKKPHFKDWIKSRKWMVLGVVGICLATVGTIIYTSGLGDNLTSYFKGKNVWDIDKDMMIDNKDIQFYEIEDADLIINGVNIKITVSPGKTQEVNNPVTFKVEAVDSESPYEYSILYGDGTEKSVPGVKVPTQTFSHPYLKAGTYNIQVSITDGSDPSMTSGVNIENYIITASQDQETKPTLEKFYYVEDPENTDEPTDPPNQFNLYEGEKVNVYFKIKDYPENGKTRIKVKNKAGESVKTSPAMDNEGVWTWVVEDYEALKDGKDYTLNIGIASVDPQIKFDESLALHVGEPAVDLKLEICDNNIDDDGDKLIDSKDIEDCEAPTPPQCSDGLDNDGDELIDLKDIEDCESEDDTLEGSDKDLKETPPQCNDTLDNDKDGDIDYPNDDGCEALNDTTESSDFNIPKGVDIKISKVSVSKTKFNPEIHEVYFVYTISGNANVKIEILDKDGKVVATAEEEKAQKKGQHVAWWNGTIDNKFAGQKIADGTYIYKITATHPEYSEVKDTKEGSITADSTAGNGEGDFEDLDGGGAKPGDKTGDKTPGDTNADDATKTLQDSTTGQTAGTGPGILLYLLIPALALPLTKKS